MKLSIALATYNEEKNIGDCLASVKDLADEIIVVDGSSSDKTRQIAKKYGAKVTKTTNKPMFHINKQVAIDKASGDWILQLDADERVTKSLAREIKNLITRTKKQIHHKGFWLKRKNFFLGRWLKKGGQYPDPIIRLFQKGYGHFPCQSVHEQIEINGPIGWLKNDLLHYTAPTFSDYLKRANRYTSLTAKDLKRNKISLTCTNTLNYLLIKPILTFIKLYFRHKGMLDGFPGFVFALFSGLHFPIAYMKYWELKKLKKFYA